MTRWRALGYVAALACIGASGVAHAQAYQCRTDDAPISVKPVSPDGPVRRIPVTGYTLALSWAPEYCRGRYQQPGEVVQCSGKHGRFGLIVHGLWPEGGNGNWPQWCGSPRVPSPQVLRGNLCMMPSARLMARQWAKHGSCMTRKPETYFRVTSILWNSLNMPDLDRLARGGRLNGLKIRQAFVDANPGWKIEQVGLSMNRRSWLQEIRLCYGKDFLPARCSKSQYGPADLASIKVYTGLGG